MTYFYRSLVYVRAQWQAVVISILCAVGTGGLFALSLSAVLPLIKVILGDEGLPAWVYRAEIQKRTGLTFIDLSLQSAEQLKNAQLFISGLSQKHDNPAQQAGLQVQDKIVRVKIGGNAYEDRPQILEQLARVPEGQSIELEVERDKTPPLTLTLTPGRKPAYANLADWLLGFVQRQQANLTPLQFKRNSIILIIIVMMISTVLRCLLRFWQEYLVNRISFRSVMALRLDCYGKVLRLPITFFNQKGISDTMSRYVQDSSQIHIGISTLLGKVIREPMTITFLAFAAFYINAKMTLIVVTAVPGGVWIIHQLGRKMKRATKRTLESWSKMLGRLQGTLLGIRVVKGYHQEAYEERALHQLNQRLVKQQDRMAKIDSASGPLLETLGMVAGGVGMIFGIGWIIQQQMDIADFLALSALLGAMAESARKLGDVITRLQTANAAAQRVYELIDTPGEPDPIEGKKLGRLAREIEFQDVCFTYPGSPVPTLDHINLKVRAGQTVAVVGPNGSGKTTLLSLIPRFFLPSSGTILIDGADIAEVTMESLRGQIGIVTQQTVVFNDTIAANIAYGDMAATMDQIESAARRAFAHEFITATAHGYQTIIGEQGATLSGGQLQRIAIARAILRDPAILIFDEAMSQIDADSEAKIQRAITEFAKNRTAFIIAHRLSTIIDAGRIVVLDAGRILATGDHLTLLNTCPLYRQLYEMQFVKEPSLALAK